jgi:hypothetical protein
LVFEYKAQFRTTCMAASWNSNLSVKKTLDQSTCGYVIPLL